MKATVFGGAGFVGSHVADALTRAGHQVAVFDIARSPYLQDGQDMIQGDILNAEAVEKAVAGRDVVYHFAGLADIGDTMEDPLGSVKVNILGTVNLLEACRKAGVRRFVFASTVYVYSQSGSFYRCSKEACEKYIETYNMQYGLDYTILRYGTLYGPRANLKNSICRYITQALDTGSVTYYGDGEEIREYIHVEDAAEASVDILAEKFRNQHIILTGHRVMKIRDLFVMLGEILGRELEVNYMDRSQSGESGHYSVTPYSYIPRPARKYISEVQIDLGQGLLSCLDEIYRAGKEAASPGPENQDGVASP